MRKGRICQAEQDRRIRQLLGFIFEFRYATWKQLDMFIKVVMNLSYSRRLMECCLKKGYIRSCVDPLVPNNLYHMTRKGQEFLYTQEPVIEHYHFEKRHAGLNTFFHHNILIEAYFLLKTHLEITEWVCEWVLRIGRERREKLPDGLMIMPNGAKVAVEMETHYKNHSMLKSLVYRYRYDIEDLEKYDRILIIAFNRLNYDGIKRRLYIISPDFCAKRVVLADLGMLEQGMCFYQGKIKPLEEALRRD